MAEGEHRFVRADGPAKVTGTGRYVADLTMTGMAIAKFRYAGVARARITRLDTQPARSMPGVLAVITADDVPDVMFHPTLADRRLFAKDEVRFEGEVVAAVAAVTEEIAEAAAAAIVFEYDELPPILDMEAAMAPGSPLVHEDWASYSTAAPDDTPRDRNVATHSEISKGDVDAGMAAADIIIKGRFVADASHATPIEPRGIVAQWEGDNVTVWTSTQVPFDARDGVCATLELPTNKVRVIVPHLGGGFGGKCGFHFEAHVAALSRAAGRPVKLVFTREEEFLAPDRRREAMIMDIETGVKADGTIVARRAWVAVENGAYTADATFFPQMASMHVTGPYQIPHLEVKADLIYTNRQPSGSVRAPTAPQGCWACETHTDEIAAALNMDPVAFRQMNIIDTGQVGPLGQIYENIGVRDCLTQAAEMIDWTRDLPENEAIGLALSWWPSFPGASGSFVKLDSDGKGQIVTGALECGTGSVMTLRNLAAGELGMEPEDFEIVSQDTAVTPWDTGATGSQTLINNGRAVVEAAADIANQLRDLAADKLEAAAADIIFEAGRAQVAGSPAKSVSIVELAGEAAGGELLIGRGSGKPPAYPEIAGLSCVGDQGCAAWAGPQFACHAVHIRLDRDTGVVRVLEVACAHDSGTIINPMGALGQVEGGVLMGIGQALTEGTRYSDQGRQENAALLEYKLQTFADAPSIATRFVQPDLDGVSQVGPHGAKGIAEAPNVPTAAAISNALAKLLDGPLRQLPMTAERVWEAQR